MSDTRNAIALLLEQGALWWPDNADQVARVRRSLFECEPDVTSELVELLIKHTACIKDTIQELLRTPAMKKHLTPVARKLSLLGFDVRTAEQKVEDKRQKDVSRQWAHSELAMKYIREEIYVAIWLEPIQRVAPR